MLSFEMFKILEIFCFIKLYIDSLSCVIEFMKALLPSESEQNKPKKGKKSGSAKAAKKKWSQKLN